MALEEIDIEGLASAEGGDLGGVLAELQGLTITVADGAADGDDITVDAIVEEDTLVSVIEVIFTEGAVTDIADLTSEASITDDDTIQCSDTDTTDNKLVVVWFNKS